MVFVLVADQALVFWNAMQDMGPFASVGVLQE